MNYNYISDHNTLKFSPRFVLVAVLLPSLRALWTQESGAILVSLNDPMTRCNARESTEALHFIPISVLEIWSL